MKEPDKKHVRPGLLSTDADLEECIRLRAYQLYEQRGRRAGHELEDWMRAEREFMEERARGVAI